MGGNAAIMCELSVVQLLCRPGSWLLPAAQISGDLVTVNHFLLVVLLPGNVLLQVRKCQPWLSEGANLQPSICITLGVSVVLFHHLVA